MGEMLSDPARAAMTGQVSPVPSVPGHQGQPFPRRGPVVTNELVDRLREQGDE